MEVVSLLESDEEEYDAQEEQSQIPQTPPRTVTSVSSHPSPTTAQTPPKRNRKYKKRKSPKRRESPKKPKRQRRESTEKQCLILSCKDVKLFEVQQHLENGEDLILYESKKVKHGDNTVFEGTALVHAAYTGNARLVKLLLDRINAQSAASGSSVLDVQKVTSIANSHRYVDVLAAVDDDIKKALEALSIADLLWLFAENDAEGWKADRTPSIEQIVNVEAKREIKDCRGDVNDHRIRYPHLVLPEQRLQAITNIKNALMMSISSNSAIPTELQSSLSFFKQHKQDIAPSKLLFSSAEVLCGPLLLQGVDFWKIMEHVGYSSSLSSASSSPKFLDQISRSILDVQLPNAMKMYGTDFKNSKEETAVDFFKAVLQSFFIIGEYSNIKFVSQHGVQSQFFKGAIDGALVSTSATQERSSDPTMTPSFVGFEFKPFSTGLSMKLTAQAMASIHLLRLSIFQHKDTYNVDVPVVLVWSNFLSVRFFVYHYSKLYSIHPFYSGIVTSKEYEFFKLIPSLQPASSSASNETIAPGEDFLQVLKILSFLFQQANCQHSSIRS